MEKPIQNMAASVHQRLLNKARATSRPFNELLQHFANERFIYRLSRSPYAGKFILKGALMFAAWRVSESRPTRDIDLLGIGGNDLDMVVSAMRDVCEMDVEPDGVNFAADTVTADRITKDADYEGVRVFIRGSLGNVRLSLQLDIGFGDVIVPGPAKVVYPTLLDFPAPELNGYSMESAIAEKLQAMVKIGILNSRMKDFYDIWFLSRSFEFRGAPLAEAIEKTFKRRSTPLTINSAVFGPLFRNDETKQSQWRGFIAKTMLAAAPGNFAEVVAAVQGFLEPVIDSVVEGHPFQSIWKAPGPWR